MISPTAPPDEIRHDAGAPRRRLLILIVAYNAEKTIENVLSRIPRELNENYDVEVLVIDDSSNDDTFERSERIRQSEALPFTLHVLFNPVNQGYGGNQKIGFQFAIERGFDFVALVHGDGQYAPERLPDLVAPLAAGEGDAVFGSRMLRRGAARAGGMPLYKLIGNRILSTFQNRVLGAALSEFHSGYRIYSTAALREIPFERNTNDFHFDTEIIIQLLRRRLRIVEVPIPTYYGDEICHVNGLRYAADVARATVKARTQDLGLLYERRFDVGAERPNAQYTAKLDYESPHVLALRLIEPGSRVLDLGCAGGYLGAELKRRGCRVVGVDIHPLGEGVELDSFVLHDLDSGLPPVDLAEFDYVLMLDVIEHLHEPERFMEDLYAAAGSAAAAKLVLSTGNVAFAVTRLMLLAGQFNYGKRGILDMTHTRLFTFSTLRRLLEGAQFDIEELRGVPPPFPLALGDRPSAHALMSLGDVATRVWERFFAYQIFAVARPRPSLDALLRDAYTHSAARAARTSV
jgi:glycosyltransferase involved in cell wall biosynthesis